MIEIILNPVNSKFSNILLSIDNISATYIVNENKIVIDQSIDLGIHILRLQLLDDHSKIDIADVTVNGSSLRQTLFLASLNKALTDYSRLLVCGILPKYGCYRL